MVGFWGEEGAGTHKPGRHDEGENVIISDEPRARMVKPRSPEPDVWKINRREWSGSKFKPTSSMLLEKYTQQWQSVFRRLRGVK
jgi:hypothetical protein